ncbi:ribonuclease III [Brevibacterium sp. p3-SID960]|uniref:ribonuclease III n=1 Tax=Brevibacterium sp. p3-SID960 TaxID=2916063 RepID=UPI0021A45578|nr:ribonuclease III [Brevibacterium sp. p3-SID960]MCT1690812.1 ribonuclease III [Brevibacterium sp. p3-SID960]
MESAPDLNTLNERLGVDIDPETLRLALTHRSYAFENGGIPTNERLEFLGDAVLQLVATESLFLDNPELPEGRLAKMRAAVVNTRALAQIARRLKIGEFVLLGKGEEMTGGRRKDSILADTVESLIGACFISRGRAEAFALVHRLIDDMLIDAVRLGAGMDFKTTLQEAAADLDLGAVVYEVTGRGPDHARVFTALALLGGTEWGAGEGTSKKAAEAVAAEAAVTAIRAAHPDYSRH